MENSTLPGDAGIRRTATNAVRSDLDIQVTTQINAELRRILYALATPEYLEAWLQLPEADRVECHAERRSFDRFQVESHSRNGKRDRLYGRCRLAKPNRVTYLLERAGGIERQSSVAEIRLLVADASQCTLELKHSFPANSEDFAWYSEMWQRSLPKLRALVEGSGATTNDPTGPRRTA
jgi:uncharacterized protein YndB with AHSA1/START domain